MIKRVARRSRTGEIELKKHTQSKRIHRWKYGEDVWSGYLTVQNEQQTILKVPLKGMCFIIDFANAESSYAVSCLEI